MFLVQCVQSRSISHYHYSSFLSSMVGLGKLSQGMSTALAVEKTSKRGGKIINVAAEKGIHALRS